MCCKIIAWIWSNFKERFSQRRALTRATPTQSSSWESWQLRPGSSPVLLLSSTCAPLLTWFSFLWRPLSRQRKAQSYVGNPGTKTAESLFPGPQVHADLENSSLFLVFFFSLPLLSFFLLGTLQRSPTQTLTQALWSYFSPNAQNTFIFQQVSSVGQVDHRHPLIQTATVTAESVHFAQRGVLPRRRLRVLQK